MGFISEPLSATRWARFSILFVVTGHRIKEPRPAWSQSDPIPLPANAVHPWETFLLRYCASMLIDKLKLSVKYYLWHDDVSLRPGVQGWRGAEEPDHRACAGPTAPLLCSPCRRDNRGKGCAWGSA